MTSEMNLTKFLKGRYRFRPTSECDLSFKGWMTLIAQDRAIINQMEPNAALAAMNWCERKGRTRRGDLGRPGAWTTALEAAVRAR